MATSRESRLRLDAQEAERARADERRSESGEDQIAQKFGPEKHIDVKEWRGNILVTHDGRWWKPKDSSVSNPSRGPNGFQREFINAHEVNGCLVEHPGSPQERVWVLERNSEHSIADTGTEERRRIFEAFDQPKEERRAA